MGNMENASELGLVGVPALFASVLLYLAAFYGTAEIMTRWRSPLWVGVVLPAPLIILFGVVFYRGVLPSGHALDSNITGFICVTSFLVGVVVPVLIVSDHITPSASLFIPRLPKTKNDIRIIGIVLAIMMLLMIDGYALLQAACVRAGACL